jgi:aryl-alcohol dehydrogenase-like predicted oxidoreductase
MSPLTPLEASSGPTRSDFLRQTGALAGAALLGPALLGSALPALAATGPVLKRPIPSSGEMIPVIGSGSAVIFDVEAQHARIAQLAESMRTLIAGGGAMIDTAPTYGQAEKRLGEVLKMLEPPIRERAFIATKISTTGEQAGIDQVTRSFADLGVARFDLLQVHNVRDTETHLKTIRRLRDEGKVRYTGITTSFERTHPEFERIMRTEKIDFIQIDYALDNRLAEQRILPLAQERGLAVIINLPFGRNRLFAKAKGRELPDFAKEIDCTSWAQFFLKFLLGHPAVTVIIPGTDRPEYALDNLAAARGRIPDAAMRKRMLDYWESLG